MKSKLLPEALYAESNLSFAEAVSLYKCDATLTGVVVDVQKEHHIVIVSLGSGLFGMLPYDEFTIYPFTYKHNSHIPDQIKHMMNKRIRVKITNIVEDNIWLSRKKNMENALEHLKQCSYAQFFVTNNTCTKLFGDIGEGITAAVSSKDLSRCRIRNVTEILHKDDLEWMKILNYDDTNRFNMSYREMFEAYDPDKYKPNDGYECIVNEAIDPSHSGYYVSVTPNTNGIMDVRRTDPVLRYGQKVFARVKCATEHGLKLYYVGSEP